MAGLSDLDLDKCREEGKWSIRQLVHHIVDCDLNYLQLNRYALAQTGEIFTSGEFNPDVWAKMMDYNSRPIHMELKMFAFIREYITYLCSSLFNSLDREIRLEHGQFNVRDALIHDTRHAQHHIDQITETRQFHGI